jgi:hypothetical protein
MGKEVERVGRRGGWRKRETERGGNREKLTYGHFLSWQIPVDIMTGVTDEQCRQMAQDLEFKGSALTEVHVHLHSLQTFPIFHTTYTI